MYVLECCVSSRVLLCVGSVNAVSFVMYFVIIIYSM